MWEQFQSYELRIIGKYVHFQLQEKKSELLNKKLQFLSIFFIFILWQEKNTCEM